VPRTTQFSELFGALPQKKLDKTRAGGYNGAGTTFNRRRTTTLAHGGVKIVVVLLLWCRKTDKIVNNLLHTRKKDLTILAFALKMARGTPNAVIVVLLLARRRRIYHPTPRVLALSRPMSFYVPLP